MINLLPPQEKKILFLGQNKKIIIILGALIVIFLLCFTFFLLLTKIYISDLVKFQEAVFGEETKKLKDFGVEEFQEKIFLFNQTLSKLKSFFQTKTYLIEILERTSEAMPSGLYLTDFSFAKKLVSTKATAAREGKEEEIVIEKEVSIYGFSPSREKLFEFKEKLEKDKMFKNIYFPPSNWVKAGNIDFYLTLKLK